MPAYGSSKPEPRAEPVLKRSVYTVEGLPCRWQQRQHM